MAFNAVDAETFMTATNSPFCLSYAPFIGTIGASNPPSYEEFAHQVVSATYYDGQNAAPVWEEHFGAENPAPAALWPTGTAYAIRSPANEPYGSLESCATLVAQLGTNKANKPIFARKYIHGLPGLETVVEVGGGCTLPLSSAGITAIQSQSNGSWAGSRVYVTPSGAQPAASAWVAIPGQHQMPRGRKKRTGAQNASLASVLLKALENGGLALGADALEAAL